MTPLFADTSYWIAMLVKTDDLHDSAIEKHRSLRNRKIITSDLVLVELLNDLSGRGPHLRKAGVELATGWLERGSDRTVTISGSLFTESLDRYAARPDKSWSFTDCASMVVCEHQSITDVFTYDHHFIQAGFNALLRE